MARQRTRMLVHAAVLEIASDLGFATVSMEGIAARAGVSKQTLYRNWPTTGAILFDALLALSTNEYGAVVVRDSGDLRADLEDLVEGSIAQLTDPTHDRLLRAVTAAIQTDTALADEFHDRLLLPQLDAVVERLRSDGIDSPDEAAELLLGPVVHRWLLRTGPFEAAWVERHVHRVLAATHYV